MKRGTKKILELKEKEIKNLREEVQRLTDSLKRLEHYKTRMKIKEDLNSKSNRSLTPVKDSLGIKEKMREIEKLKLLLDKRNEQIARIESDNTELIKDNKRIVDKMLGEQIYNKKKMDFMMMLAIQSKTIEKLLREREDFTFKIKELEEMINQLVNIERTDVSCQTPKIMVDTSFLLKVNERKDDSELFDFKKLYEADFEIISPARKKIVKSDFGVTVTSPQFDTTFKRSKLVNENLTIFEFQGISPVKDSALQVDNPGPPAEGDANFIDLKEMEYIESLDEGNSGQNEDDVYDEYDDEFDMDETDNVGELDSINENEEHEEGENRRFSNFGFDSKINVKSRDRASLGDKLERSNYEHEDENIGSNQTDNKETLWRGGRDSDGVIDFSGLSYGNEEHTRTKIVEEDDGRRYFKSRITHEGENEQIMIDEDYNQNMDQEIGQESEESLDAYDEPIENDNAIEDVIKNSANEDVLIYEDFKSVEGTNSANLRMFQQTMKDIEFINLDANMDDNGAYDIPKALKNFEDYQNQLNNLKQIGLDPDLLDPKTQMALNEIKRDNEEMSRKIAMEKAFANGEPFAFERDFSAEDRRSRISSKEGKERNYESDQIRGRTKKSMMANAYNVGSMDNLHRKLMSAGVGLKIEDEDDGRFVQLNDIYNSDDRMEDLLTNNKQLFDKKRLLNSSNKRPFENKFDSSYMDNGRRLVPKVDSNLEKITKISKNAAQKWTKILQNSSGGEGKKKRAVKSSKKIASPTNYNRENSTNKKRKNLRRGNTFNIASGYKKRQEFGQARGALSNTYNGYESSSQLDDSYSQYTTSGIKVRTLYSKNKKKKKQISSKKKKGNWAKVKPKPRHNKLKTRGLNKKAMNQIEKMYYNEYFDKNSPHHPEFYRSLGNKIHLTRETHIINDLSSNGRSFIGAGYHDDVSLNFN